MNLVSVMDDHAEQPGDKGDKQEKQRASDNMPEQRSYRSPETWSLVRVSVSHCAFSYFFVRSEGNRDDNLNRSFL
jgi:hypothetical protein